MSVQEIERAIQQLAPAERAELIARLVERDYDDWDKQIADDLDSGRLDSLLVQVDKEIEAGLAKPM